MKRKVVNLLLTKITAILLVASMTVSIIMSSDKNCALFNAIANVFADEIDDPANEGEYSENDADTIDSGDTEVSDITDTVEGDDTVEPENTEGITAEPSETESNTEDNETGLVYRQVKAEGEDDLYVSGLMPEDIRVTAESVEVEVSGAYVIAAYDIKVFDVNGNEWQPEQPLTISVAPDSMNAKSEDETQVIYVPDELAESGNPVDIDDKSIEKIDAVIEDGNVVFEAEHFSVYVIIEHEGGDVVTPRVEFHFISPVGETYQPTVTGGIAYYTSTPYVFNNKADEAGAGNHQVTSIVRDGDKLESIEAPMNTQNTYFYGWYAVDLSSENVTFNTSSQTFSGNITYSWPNEDPLRVELDKTVSVSAARDSSNNITSVTWTIGSVSGTSTDVDASGCAHVYLAPIYSNYYFVNFHLGARGETTAETLLSRKLIVLGNSNLTHVKISDVQAPSNDPVHVVFIGWEENTGTEQNPVWSLIRTIDSDNNEIIQPGMDGTYIEVGPKTVDLYPFFVQARYINFNIGASGNGALYLGPQLMFTSDEAAGDEYALTSLPTTTRAGYTFAGWYTGADGTGTQITDASGNIRNISYSETGSYTGVNGITYSGISYKIENGKIYAYNALDELTLYAKWTPNITATYKVVIWKQRSSDAAGITDANKTYDYETYFYDNAWNTSNPVTENTLRSFSGYDASGNTVGPRNLLDMTFTGFKAGRYDYVGDVNPQGSTVINVYYDRITFNLKFIFARRQLSNGSETGNFLVPVLNNRFNPPSTITWQAYCTQGTGINWDSANTTVLSQVCSYPANRIESADYNGYRYYFYVITANYDSLIASEWPDYNNFPTVGANNANRRLSGWWLMATADLYGSPGQNDTVKGVVSTMDELILGDPDSPDGNFLIASYRTSTPNNWTYNIYMETLSGVDYSGQTTVTRNNKTYYLADSFVARSSNTDLSQQNAPAYSGFEDGERVSGGTLTANFYYTRKSYNLTFSANYPLALAGNAPAAQVFTNISYDQSLASYSSTAAPATPSNDYYFDGWYEDASGTVPFDFAHETMPSANKIVYAKWSLVEYQINIDPNGGIVDSIDYSWFTSHNTLDVTGLSGTNNGYATYYDNEATQLIEPYNNLVRPYVEVSEAEAASMPAGTVYRYVYVYRSNQEGGTGKLGAAARTAVYIKDTEESLSAFYDYYCEQVRLRQARDPQLTALPRAQWEATYVSTEKYRTLRSGESYVFLAWYEEVNGVRQNTPFDFSKPAEHETTLVAEWRLDGGYSLLYATEYYADNNDYITANLEDWTDPLDGTSKYADGATTQAMQEPTSVMVNGKGVGEDGYVDYQFLGWQIVKVETVAGRLRYTPLEPGVYYTAGQDLTVRARYSDANMVIHMQAVYQKRGEAYRRPEVVSLTLDASEDAMHVGTGSVDLTNSTLPDWYWPGHYWADSTHIYFGDTQANTALYLYKYATTLTESEETGATLTPAGVNYFKHSGGFKLIGFDIDAPDTDFVPDIASDAVIAVSPAEEHTLYAVWEPMVYLDIVNTTEQSLTVSLSSTSPNALYVVNQADGSFSRSPVDTSSVVVAPGTTRLVMPYGAGENFTLSGTNTLGVGYEMTVTSTYAGRSSSLDPVPVTKIKNTKTYSISDQFYEDSQGRAVTVTLSAIRMPRTLVLHDNDTVDATWEQSFDISEISYVLQETRVRVGRVFRGWDEDPNATTATYPIDNNGLMNQTLILNDFFKDNGGNPVEEKHLYAVWGSNDQEGVVKVYKEVPAPGDTTKAFSFDVNIQGRFRQNNGWNASYNQINDTKTFTLSHGQYLEIDIEHNTGGRNVYAVLRVAVQKYNADGTKNGSVEYVGWIANSTGQYNTVDFTNVSVTETSDNNYVTSTEIVGLYSVNFPITPAGTTTPNNAISWTNDRAGGTVVFTNTRKTADVTIKKTLLPDTVDPENFRFTASLANGESYTLNPTTKNILSGADANNGGEWKIEGIPTGATLTITETVDADRYETVAAGVIVSTNSAVTDKNAADNIFAFDVTDDTEVTFTNTLKSQKIRIVVVDDESPANYLDSANFTLPGVFPGTKFSAAGTGLVWEGTAFVGNYTLTETAMPDHAGVRYTKLQAPATLNIAGGTGGDKVTVTTGDPADTVNVTYDSVTDTYTITVVNPKMMRVTLKKSVVNDIINNSFLFTVTLTDSSNNPIQLSNVYGTQGTNASGKLDFTLVNNQTALLYVPRHANIQIVETEDNRYATVYRDGPDADHLGVMNGGTIMTLSNINADHYVLCTNTRQIVGVTVEKTVVGQGGTFSFTARVTDNSTPLANYTLNDNSTPADSSDDIVTDSSGIATFTLSPADDGTDSIVLYMPGGVDLTVTEAEPTTTAYTTTYTVVDPNDPTNNTSGTGYTTGAIRISGTRIVTFTNTVASLIAPTAVTDNSKTAMVLMFAGAAIFAGAVIRLERKKKGGQGLNTNDE